MKPPLRVHKALTVRLRTQAKSQGVRLDEEKAQLLLQGFPVVADPLLVMELHALRDALMNRSDRLALMDAWEAEHPGRNPYPPPFAETLRDDLRALLGLLLSGADPELAEDRIQAMIAKCSEELKDDEDQ